MVVVVAEPEDKSDWAASIAEGSAAGSGQVQYPFLSYITDGAIQFYRSSLGGGGARVLVVLVVVVVVQTLIATLNTRYDAIFPPP